MEEEEVGLPLAAFAMVDAMKKIAKILLYCLPVVVSVCYILSRQEVEQTVSFVWQQKGSYSHVLLLVYVLNFHAIIRAKPWLGFGVEIAKTFAAWIYISICVSVAIVGLIDFTQWLRVPGEPRFKLFIGLFAVAFAGGGLFIFRLKRRFVYGITETTAGLFSAYSILNRIEGFDMPTSLEVWFALLTASVYLVVR